MALFWAGRRIDYRSWRALVTRGRGLATISWSLTHWAAKFKFILFLFFFLVWDGRVNLGTGITTGDV